MINSAHPYPLASIFSPDVEVKYVIPKYQREYTWGKDNWDALLDDIIENASGHFIGTIICINHSDDALGVPPLELIDGQQRLTTLSLLYAAIYKRMSELADPRDEDTKLDLINLKRRVLLKSTNEPRLELSVQNNNFGDYKTALDQAGLKGYPEKNLNWGNRIIAKAFRYYYDKRLADYSLHGLKELLDAVNAALLVKIEVSNTSDAFMLFESLNNRGVPLSPIDLVKNAMLSKLDKQGGNIEDAFRKWNSIISSLPTEQDQERFLRQYYNAFRNEKNIQVVKIPRATRSNLIKIYDKLIARDVNNLFSELLEKSRIYNHVIVPSIEDEKYAQYYRELKDLVNVKAAPSYTFVLYLYCKHEKANTELVKQVLGLLMKYFVRRNLTDFPNTNDLDNIFMRLIDQLEVGAIPFSLKDIERYLTQSDLVSDLDVFRSRLAGDIYETNTDMARFILTKLEESKTGTKEHRDLYGRENNKLVWTIEHIFPEGTNIPKAWVEMIANGDSKEAKDLQNKYVHTIGNLTLTGYNSTLSNMSFDKKRDRQKDGKFVGYRNGLYLNKDLVNKNAWTIDDIKLRTTKLVEESLDLFRFHTEIT